jgi:hypothetical protein
MNTKYRLSKEKKLSTSAVCSTGDVVARSGIYTVFHHHRLSRQVPLLRSGVFPACHSCATPLEFELARAVPIESARSRFRLLMQANAPNSMAVPSSDSASANLP